MFFYIIFKTILEQKEAQKRTKEEEGLTDKLGTTNDQHNHNHNELNSEVIMTEKRESSPVTISKENSVKVSEKAHPKKFSKNKIMSRENSGGALNAPHLIKIKKKSSDPLRCLPKHDPSNSGIIFILIFFSFYYLLLSIYLVILILFF